MSFSYSTKFALFLAIVTTFISSCSLNEVENSREILTLEEQNFSVLPGWNSTKEGNFSAFKNSMLKSCNKLSSSKPNDSEASICYYGIRGFCDELANTNNIKQTVEKYFKPYLVKSDLEAEGLFTAYYEATIEVYPKQIGEFNYPIYALPSDKDDLDYTRAEINQGALKGKDLEIFWTNDAVELFFMHIQGSGKAILPDGEILSLQFAGKNNHEYSSIGKFLIEKNIFTKDNMSAPALKKFLKDNPKYANQIMELNDSFIFFSQSSQNISYPKGSESIELTPLGSIAVDKTKLPMNLPFWIDSTYPNGDNLNRLMVSQDTGSAIKGYVRADIFMGRGDRAEILAGFMKQPGRYFLLAPKQIDPYSCF
jgi:membrane-bound lytic murein transglycosylase A